MQKQKLSKKILIVGGGSGGHVSVALSIINELSKRYSNISTNLLYVGGDLAQVGDRRNKSIEQKEMEGRKDVPFVVIRAGKLQRQIAFSTISLLFRSLLGYFDARRVIKRYKPDIIISTGGYVSVPVSIVAWMKKIPLYLHEQTAAIGLSNKIASKVAIKVFVAFKESMQFFPHEKSFVVGNPIREDIFNTEGKTKLTRAIDLMEKNNLPIIYVSGGGMGSHVINIALRESLSQLLEYFNIILQTGSNETFKDFEVLTNDWLKLPKDAKERLYITKYVEKSEIGRVFKSASFFVGRSGANTVYELGVLRKPAILVPIPWVTNNEQERNAKVLKNVGLAKILAEGELGRDRFVSEVKSFYNTLNKLNLDETEINTIFKRDAVSKMIDMMNL